MVDRVNLGLIPSSEAGWPTACRALKPQGGILHVHANVTSCVRETGGSIKVDEDGMERIDSSRTIGDGHSQCKKNRNRAMKKCVTKTEWEEFAAKSATSIKGLLIEAHKGLEWTTNVIHIEHVKSYAPRIDHIVVDIQCTSST